MIWIIGSLLLFFVFLIKRENMRKVFQRMSMQLVVGVFLLYIVQIVLTTYGTTIYINAFSIAMVTLLGFPGVLTVVFISFLR